jgi:hypothetical protein
MATRQGLLTAQFESTPAVLAAVSQVIEECNEGVPLDLIADSLVGLRELLEGLAWAPPQDRERALVMLAATAVHAIASAKPSPVPE